MVHTKSVVTGSDDGDPGQLLHDRGRTASATPISAGSGRAESELPVLAEAGLAPNVVTRRG